MDKKLVFAPVCGLKHWPIYTNLLIIGMTAMQIVVGITFQNPGKYLQNFGVIFEPKGLIVRTKKKREIL